jgi:hypothetical protein
MKRLEVDQTSRTEVTSCGTMMEASVLLFFPCPFTSYFDERSEATVLWRLQRNAKMRPIDFNGRSESQISKYLHF